MESLKSHKGIYDYYWLESYDRVQLKRVFAKKIKVGWEGWATGDELSHSEMLKMYVTTWLHVLWEEVTEEYAVAEIERYWKEIEDKRRNTKTW